VLVNRIAPLIRTGGRLINLSSSGHRYSNVDLQDPNFERTPYEPFVAYGRSKTANILFAVAFDERHRKRGVRAAAVSGRAFAKYLRASSPRPMRSRTFPAAMLAGTEFGEFSRVLRYSASASSNFPFVHQLLALANVLGLLLLASGRLSEKDREGE
jgi:NAD(P)-dependent dehydrogenase (short-subunit alcohol dehydrogenase family)